MTARLHISAPLPTTPPPIAGIPAEPDRVAAQDRLRRAKGGDRRKAEAALRLVAVANLRAGQQA